MPTDTTQLDPSVVALMHGLKQNEGGDDYNAIGDEGTAAGIGQWSNQPNGKPVALGKGQIPSNFVNDAKQYGLDPTDFSPENQNKVIYSVLSADKKAGLSPEQSLSKWNSGDPNKYLDTATSSGTGAVGYYNVSDYVKKGMASAQAYAKQNKQGSNQDNSQTDSSGFTNTAILPPPAPSTTSNQDPGIIGNIEQGNFGGAAGDAVQDVAQGIASPFLKGASNIAGAYDAITVNQQGAQDIQKNGINYGYLGTQKPIGAGFDVTKGLGANAGALGDAVGTGIQAGSTLAAGAGALGGVKGLITGGIGSASALGSDVAQEALSSYALEPGESISDLTASDKVNALTSALNNASPSDKIILQKALSEVAPQVLKEAGIGSFSELNPKTAKLIGLTGKALKGLLKYGVGLAGFEELKGLLK